MNPWLGKNNIIYIIFLLVQYIFKNIITHPNHRSVQSKTKQKHTSAHPKIFSYKVSDSRKKKKKSKVRNIQAFYWLSRYLLYYLCMNECVNRVLVSWVLSISSKHFYKNNDKCIKIKMLYKFNKLKWSHLSIKIK